jgi:small nuclear ribonucleoprotein (snRNP)-like protein
MRTILIAFLLTLSSALFAQEQNRVVVVLANGNEYIGTNWCKSQFCF